MQQEAGVHTPCAANAAATATAFVAAAAAILFALRPLCGAQQQQQQQQQQRLGLLGLQFLVGSLIVDSCCNAESDAAASPLAVAQQTPRNGGSSHVLL